MPFLVYNLGGEMLYILEQRLHAQNIVREKAVRVLQDVGTAMFSEELLMQLCKPQQMQSMAAIRHLFERIAHSSIMKLSESSMEKLFELMLMGIKYQVVRCVHPRQVVEVTSNHLESVLQMIDGTSTVDMVKKVQSRVMSLAAEIPNGEFALIRQTLLNVLQDKRIKVSLFLQDNVQLQDGTLVMVRGGQLPTVYDPTLELPGAVRYYHVDGITVRQSENLTHPDSVFCIVPASPDQYARFSLGYNMYTVSKKAPTAPPAAIPQPVQAPSPVKAPLPPVRAPPPTTTPTPSPVKVTAPTTPAAPATRATGGEAAALQSLANFIVGAPSSAAKGAPNVHIINLFNEDRGGSGGSGGGGSNIIQITQITREELEKYNAELVDVMNDMGGSTPQKAPGGNNKPAAGGDLLDLLDMT